MVRRSLSAASTPPQRQARCCSVLRYDPRRRATSFTNADRKVMTTRTLYAAAFALTGAIFAHAEAALAQAYPAKLIRWVVPSSAGGGADTITRIVANALPAVLGQRVIVDNRAGAS